MFGFGFGFGLAATVAKVVIVALLVVLAAILVWGFIGTAQGRKPWGERTAVTDASRPWSVLGKEAAANWMRLLDEGEQQDQGGKVRHGLREETKGKHLLEEMLGVPFEKIRPKWLTNPETGRALEIDCYSDDLKLGVEFSGAQHSMFVPFYHGTPEGFAKQVKRDKLKAELCEKQGVTLLTVPYWEYGERLEPYLRRQLAALGFLEATTTTAGSEDAVLAAIGAISKQG